MHSARYVAACAILTLSLTACGGGGSGGTDGGTAVTDHCKSPSKICGGACVDPRTDNANCGTCGNACANGEVCAGGTCGTSCGPDLTRCTANDGTDHCRDTADDPANCGTCGNACTAPANAAGACAGGKCAYLCADGYADCNVSATDGCETDIANDPDNCGACGHVCPTGPNQVGTCTSGQCGVACAPGYSDCNGDPSDGCEVHTAVDTSNCGTCGNTCTAGAHQRTVCDAGTCTAPCEPGYGDCNGNPADGCEMPLGTVSDCDACGDTCSAATHASAACRASVCGLSCDTGYLDCNGNPADGCEVDGQTDNNHCGACGTVCTVGAHASADACTSGSCVSTCNAGYGDCNGDPSDGCEADLNVDTSNCGTCGNPCTYGYTCKAGTCTAPAAGTLDQSYPYVAGDKKATGYGKSVYQTYVAGLTGNLGQVGFWAGLGGGCATFSLEVYAGAGTGGTKLATLPAVQACNTTPGLFHVPTSVAVPQQAGQTYTLSFVRVSGYIASSYANAYANGCANQAGFSCPGNSPYDVNFQTWVR